MQYTRPCYIVGHDYPKYIVRMHYVQLPILDNYKFLSITFFGKGLVKNNVSITHQIYRVEIFIDGLVGFYSK